MIVILVFRPRDRFGFALQHRTSSQDAPELWSQSEIDDRVAPLVRELDHQVLNEIEGLGNPTSELLARWWWQRLASRLPGLCEVVVAETPTSRCVYHGR
jgi:6-pyruvoyltetrahydropterin/6-carboxytetrahydropterin synthase